MNKFGNYITSYQIIFHINHVDIRYLMNKTNVSNKVIRWLLLLWEFDLTIMDKPRKNNVVADFLSRLEHKIDQEIMEDLFPDEHLFYVSTKIPWFANMVKYLAT